MGHVVLPRVLRTAADKADIYGGVPDALFAPLSDVTDKSNANCMPKILARGRRQIR